MSTAVESNAFLRNPKAYDDQINSFATFRPVGTSLGGEQESGIRFGPVSKKRSSTESQKKARVLRRLSGFLMEFQGKAARVTFVENGKQFEYEMPSEQLEKSGIKMANQPFQMDEVEMQTDDGFFIGYQFRPLASEADVYSDPLDFDADRKKKLQLILKKFAKAST